MMSKKQKYHWSYRLWMKVRGVLAMIVVLAGLTVGLLSLLLPFESLYQQKLTNFLESQWNLDVKVNEIEGSWQGYGPYFELKKLELTGKQSVQLAHASLSINVYQWLVPGGRTGIDLSINKAELDMIHASGGASFTINDDQDQARLSGMLDRVLSAGSLSVDEMMFNLADESGAILLEGLKADLLLQQDEINRAVKIVVENGNQSIEVISQALRTEDLTKDANWYVNFNQFELSQLNEMLTEFSFPGGQINGQIWATTTAGHINTMSGEISWQNQSGDFDFEIQIKQFSQDKDWQASLLFKDIVINGEQVDEFTVRIQRQDQFTQVKSAEIPISIIAQLAFDTKLLNFNDGVSPQVDGLIDQLAVNYNHTTNDWLGTVNFSALGMSHSGFNFSGLNGLFEFNQDSGNLLLESQGGQLSIPQIYRGNLKWTDLTVQNSIDWSNDETSVLVNNFWCACTDFDLNLWANMSFGKPLSLLLSSELSHVDVAELYKYWPHNIWKPKTMAWLDRGLLSGSVDRGLVFVNGDMVHEAFKSGAAEFVSRAYSNDVNNIFHPEWPQVNGIDAVAIFNHDSAHVDITKANTEGILVYDAKVDIASFDRGILGVQLKASSSGNDILEYIRISPLVKNIELNENIQVGGEQDIDLNFDVAIKPEVNLPFQPEGEVVFNQGKFSTEHFSIDQINGPVRLDGYTLLMNDVPAQLGSADVLLNGEIITKSDEGFGIDVNLDGILSADYLLDVIKQELPIQGQSEWQINIKNLKDQLKLFATSSLSGTEIQLPAPLDKSLDEAKQLSISCIIPCQESTVEINYNNQIKSTLDTESGQYHLARLQFLDLTTESNEAALFGGRIERLDLDEWLDLLVAAGQQSQPESKNQWPVNEISLSLGEMVFMSRAFESLDLEIKRLPRSYEISVKGEQMQGVVLIDDDLAQKGIVAEFEHLDWIEPIENTEDLIQDAVNSKVPDIHLWAKSFKYAGIPLGEMRMEMRNVADGIKVEQLSLKSPEAEINVSGFWNKAIGQVGRSQFDIVMISERIADFLKQVGFNAPITNAQTLIELNAEWDGVPSQFNIANIDGDLSIKIGQGQVLDQKPGFGRVLGLFNLTNLPRRLILDFRDVLADGLLFSGMEGHFNIESGVARTDDFLITASSAKIHIKGDVGFADQSYDQTISVRPQIGKTFPTLGAIAGGPVGAAAGFLVQGLFDKQLKKGNEIIYKVTGTWDEPEIELIEKE